MVILAAVAAVRHGDLGAGWFFLLFLLNVNEFGDYKICRTCVRTTNTLLVPSCRCLCFSCKRQKEGQTQSSDGKRRVSVLFLVPLLRTTMALLLRGSQTEFGIPNVRKGKRRLYFCCCARQQTTTTSKRKKKRRATAVWYHTIACWLPAGTPSTVGLKIIKKIVSSNNERTATTHNSKAATAPSSLVRQIGRRRSNNNKDSSS